MARKLDIGEDGWRLYGPGSADNEDFERAAHERRFHREMQPLYERWQRGDVTAFSEAMRLCERYERPPLDWLVDASKVLVERAMAEDEKRARREWRIAWTRWEMVTELRKRGDELFRHRRAELERAGAALERERAKLKEATTAEERARSTEECAHSAKLLSELVEAGDDDRGTNLERAREAVSESLAGHEAAGSPDTIKASYELIEAAGGEQATFESFRKERERRQEQWKRPWKRGKRG